MKYVFLVSTALLITQLSFSQTYSKLVADSDINNVITQEIARDKLKTETINLNITAPMADLFYYKDAADFKKKDQENEFIFKKTNHLDSLFSRKDIDFFLQQINAVKNSSKWKKPFAHTVLFDETSLKPDQQPKNAIYSYSIPVFSADRQRAILMKRLYCGAACGIGAFYIYKRGPKNNWMLLKKINEWQE